LRPVETARLVLLSKSDKLSRAERAKTLASTRTALESAALPCDLMMFSSKSGEGVEESRALLEGWLRNPREKPRPPVPE